MIPQPSNDSETGGTVLLSEHDGVALLRLGAPGEKLVVLTERRMDSLAESLAGIAKRSDLKGLVIAGPEGGAFCAPARRASAL